MGRWCRWFSNIQTDKSTLYDVVKLIERLDHSVTWVEMPTSSSVAHSPQNWNAYRKLRSSHGCISQSWSFLWNVGLCLGAYPKAVHHSSRGDTFPRKTWLRWLLWQKAECGPLKKVWHNSGSQVATSKTRLEIWLNEMIAIIHIDIPKEAGIIPVLNSLNIN